MSDISPVDPKSTLSYRLLRAVVIVLGALIVIGLVVLVVGLATRFSAHGAPPPAAALYTLPQGARIAASDMQGDRLVLRVQTRTGEEIDIVDTQSGRLIGQVKAPK